MEYTYTSYKNLMNRLIRNKYKLLRFCDVSEEIDKSAIIRHDVDVDIQEALKMAELEHEIGIKSTYFILLTSEYYNLLSGRNMMSARKILALDHEIGLHFDITAYGDNLSIEEASDALRHEITVMEAALNLKVKSFSWHIPRKDFLGLHLPITDELGILNAYDPYFYSGFKYVSDSMMRWREPIEEYIENNEYRKLQILTHPIWYRETQDKTDVEILKEIRFKKHELQDQYIDTIRPGFNLKINVEESR